MSKEQNVRVGILKSNKIVVVFHREYLLDGKPFVGEQEFGLSDAGKAFVPSCDDCSFTLKNVVIGICFHWERKEDQTFRGALQLIEEDGQLRAVNVVPVETYLTSVISSEMSANASLELLKAHAVISRSWVMRIVNPPTAALQCDETNDSFDKKDSLQNNSQNSVSDNDESVLEIVKWYDSEGHKSFHVCADDHCQRYQGITRQTNPNVEAAIDATRGEVLMCDGEVCDARFSKCCGGIMETFENCWQPVKYRYLVAKADPYCNTNDISVLKQVLNNYDQETSDFYRWTVTYSVEQLSELVSRKSGIDFGRIADLVPIVRGESGRIVKLKIVGEKRTVIVGKELEIRKWLSESHLYSSAFDVAKEDDRFVLRGKGWGHGVGLCQIGAAVMGSKGYGYREILQHYYPETVLERLW